VKIPESNDRSNYSVKSTNQSVIPIAGIPEQAFHLRLNFSGLGCGNYSKLFCGIGKDYGPG